MSKLVNPFNSLCFAYNEAYPSKTKQVCQAEVTEIWRSLKDEKDKEEKLDDMMKKFKSIVMKRKGNMFSYWGNLSQKSEKKSQDKSLTSSNGSSSEIPIEFLPDSSQFDEPQEKSQSDEHPSTSKEAQATTTSKTKAQDELKDKLNLVNSDLLTLQKQKDCDMLSEEQDSEFKKKKKQKMDLEKELKKKSR